MDAAHKLSRKASPLFAMAVLFAAPAFAQTLQVSPTDITLPNGGLSFANVSVTSSTGSAIPFTVARTNPSDTWYNLQVVGSGSTPDTVQVILVSTAGGAKTGTFTITNTNNTADVQTVTVHYVPGSTGGGGSGLISASPSPLNVQLASGVVASSNIQLSTTSTSPLAYSTSFSSTGNFITGVTTNQSTVSSVSQATLTVNMNTAGLGNGVYQGQILITPTGGQSITVNVNLTVGTGVGSTTYQFGSGTTYNFSYPTGTQQAFTTVTSSTATTYNAQTSSANNWLLVNGVTSTGSQFTSNGLTLSLNTAAASTLTTGSYTGTVTVTNPLNFSDQALLTVFLIVNQGTLPNLTVSPSSVTFNVAAGTTSLSTSQINLSASSNTTITGVTFTSTTGWLSAFVTNSIFTLPTSITVSANPSSLQVGTYNGSVSVTFSGGVNGTQTIPVTLVVGSGSGGGVNGVAPTALSFAYQFGSNSFAPQQSITVSGTGNISVGTLVQSGSIQWLSASSTGSAPGLVIVSVIAGGLSVGQYSGTVPVITSSGTTNVAVTLNVTSGAVLYSNPGTLNVTSSSTTQITVSASDNSSIPFTATSSASWVTLGTPTSSSTPSTIPVTINTAGLANGVNTANISITTGSTTTSLQVPVVASVAGSSSGGVLTLSQSSLSFNATVGGAAPSSQTLSVSSPSTTTFTVTTSVQTGGTNWLSVSPSGSLNTNQTLTVSVNPAGLSANTYNGTISLTVNGVTQNVPVTLVVGGGSVTVSPTSLSFSSTGATTQSVSVASSVSGSSAIAYSVAATTTSGGSWLTASASNGVTPGSFNAVVNSAGLATGSYQGTITVTPSAGGPVSIPVTLSVTVATVTATTANGTTLNFTYRVGDASPPSQAITVGGSTGAAFTATASSNGNWLGVSSSSGVAPVTLQATVSPTGLNPGSYSGTITVAGSAGATGSTTITANLTVTAPLPTINTGGITNAASYVGGAIAPGEIITIFGTDIGPSPAVTLQLDSAGRVATTLGGVQVLVNGFAAPLIFVSQTQISAVVPYELAPFLTANVQVRYLGQTSNGITANVAATAPGIFTANRTGTGPAAIYDANQNAFNGPGNPAARGDTLLIYMTGEGITSPAITGRVTPTTPPFTLPLLVPTVLIDGQPARVDFYGEAPGFTSGLLQLNVVVPSNANTGDRPLVVRMNGVDSQPGITVSIR